VSVGTAAAADERQQPPATTSESASPFGVKGLDERALERQRGGTDPGTLTDMKLNGVVGNNSASNLTTGNNSIADGAFANMSGVPLVVQNTGNNVLIQSATIINVQVK
jgi:hypothetical protein